MLRSTRIVLAVAQRLCKLGQCVTLDKDDEEEKKKEKNNTPGKGRENMETKTRVEQDKVV